MAWPTAAAVGIFGWLVAVGGGVTAWAVDRNHDKRDDADTGLVFQPTIFQLGGDVPVKHLHRFHGLQMDWTNPDSVDAATFSSAGRGEYEGFAGVEGVFHHVSFDLRCGPDLNVMPIY